MSSSDNLPAYRDLPVGDGKPPRSTWGMWGERDVLGALNLITADRVRAGAAEVNKGSAFPLNLELELPDPPLSGRAVFEHRVTAVAGGLGNDDEYNNFNVQASSQLDGFAHVQHPGLGFYNGLPVSEHGMHHWARRGLAARAVLVDVAGWRASVGRPLRQGDSDPITTDDLQQTLEAQHSLVEPGDILLIRTGFVTWYRGLSHDERTAFSEDLKMPGLAQGEAMAELLWNMHPSAIAADNMALEVWPPVPDLAELMNDPKDSELRFLHIALIPLLGIPIGELWDLDALAADCADDGRYSCQITMAAMNKLGGIASMANAVAVK